MQRREWIRSDLHEGRWGVPTDVGKEARAAQLKQARSQHRCVHSLSHHNGPRTCGSALEIAASNEDFPALGKPTSPMSATSLSVRRMVACASIRGLSKARRVSPQTERGIAAGDEWVLCMDAGTRREQHCVCFEKGNGGLWR